MSVDDCQCGNGSCLLIRPGNKLVCQAIAGSCAHEERNVGPEMKQIRDAKKIK